MDIVALLTSLESSGLATAIRNATYAFPLIESAHVIGLTLVFGTILILDLRLLGLASTRRPFSAVASDVLKWTWGAFVLTVSTGLLMFITGAVAYYNNPYFRAKLVLLALAGLNTLVFEFTARRSLAAWDADAKAPRAGQAAAALSLALWVGVIFLGRWIGFAPTMPPPPAEDEINFEELENLIPK